MNRRSLDSLNGIVVFVRVVEAGSFVDAARVLGLSPSAVSKGVSRLEAHLGARLFRRNTRSVTLTTEGELFLERCRRVLGEIEAAEHELADAGRLPRGKLKISLPLVSGLILPVLSAFMREYPHVQLDLDFSNRLVDVIEEGFDAVVRTGVPADSRLQSKRLGSHREILVAAPAYLDAHGVPQTPADLSAHACLHHRYSSSGQLSRWAFPQENLPPDWRLPVTMVSNNMETLVYFATQGHGIACVPDFTVQQALASGELQSVLGDCIENASTFWLLWPAVRPLPPRLRVFIDFMSANLFPGSREGSPPAEPTKARHRKSLISPH
ncbi:MAG: LysR family transcriptional regulator [Rudaea sp.]|uniref:LysR family transcriptional regulator n=1 Tax=unclassified Rudaea TaxID=2627037 RepID=UPI001AD29171|nr:MULTISPECIES: LysR family transcriptional regulator [unclassified Rudaea]MBN8888412.1 LysR family transcriptional regulator [Rudaea sp.]MBR0347197.1 LysR family transcriptional regulator [Rudaea sp.]